MIVTRFAPSPNGPLHLGHAFAALVAHDLARERGGRFLLRIEDIDGTRSRADMVDAVLADLRWLGADWDGEPVFQSARLAHYAAAGERLKAMNLLYPCRCTRAEIAAAATEYGPDGPVYPGTCKHGDVDPGDAAWRLDVAKAMDLAGPLAWVDELAGVQSAVPQIFGDVVLLRKDLPASYHLAATLDDAADGVTLVTRGADLFAATHIHRLLQALLGLPVPRWHHHGLLAEAGADGRWRKLAKRRGSGQAGSGQAGSGKAGFGLADRRRSDEDGRALADALRAGRLPAGICVTGGVWDGA